MVCCCWQCSVTGLIEVQLCWWHVWRLDVMLNKFYMPAVKFADVLTGSDNRSKGCGIVEFENPQEAADAINKLHNSQVGCGLVCCA